MAVRARTAVAPSLSGGAHEGARTELPHPRIARVAGRRRVEFPDDDQHVATEPIHDHLVELRLAPTEPRKHVSHRGQLVVQRKALPGDEEAPVPEEGQSELGELG